MENSKISARNFREQIICAGFGGQGIMFLGKLLAQAAMKEGRFVTWMPSYGAEVRGGTAHSMVVISDKEVASPVVTQPTTAMVMNQPSLNKFLPKTKSGGLVIINTSLAKLNGVRTDVEVLEIPATDIATQLGNVRVGNMVVLGAYLAKRKILSLERVLNALQETVAAKFLELNECALRFGFNL
jgi:2-oxoglutarate ferredoxin oxidoreductase subunit gamma